VEYIYGLINNSFEDEIIPEDRIKKLLEKLIVDGLVQVDVDTTSTNSVVQYGKKPKTLGNWYELTGKGRKFLEQIANK